MYKYIDQALQRTEMKTEKVHRRSGPVPREGWLLMQCGSCLHHEPPLTTPLQEVAPEPSAGLHSGQESTRPTNSSPRGLSGQSSPRNKPLCALLVQGKLPHHQLQTQTHAHLRLSYGAPVCRVKADSCGPLVRAVGVAPKCRL